MKRSIYFAVLIITLLWLYGCDQKPAIQVSGEKVKVGIIAPLSGSTQASGEEGLKGIDAAKQLQPHLQNGDAVELVVEDDKNDPSLTVEALKKLVEVDRVSAILILSSSDSALAAARVAEDYETPILALLATHPDITGYGAYVSQLCFDDKFQGKVAALFVRDELLIDRVAVFNNPDSAYSSQLALEFSNKFNAIGGQITGTVSIIEKSGDYTDTLNSVRDSNPELLYLPISAKDLIRIAKAAEKLEWEPMMMGSDGLLATVTSQFEAELGILEGMLATDFASHSMPLSRYGERLDESFVSLYDSKGSTYTVLGAEGYALLINAMNRCNHPSDRACINGMIRSTDSFIGVAGPISIDSNGKASRPVFINSIQNGRMEYIVKVY